MLKLHVGYSQKMGLPHYGSVGASCQLELELDGCLVHADSEGFQRHVQNAFVACRQAVLDELGRHQNSGPDQPSNGAAPAPSSPSSTAPSDSANGHERARPPARPATLPQIRALHAIARREGLDLGVHIQECFGVGEPHRLSVEQASQLIDALQSPSRSCGDG